jgi:hypothetical protein
MGTTGTGTDRDSNANYPAQEGTSRFKTMNWIIASRYDTTDRLVCRYCLHIIFINAKKSRSVWGGCDQILSIPIHQFVTWHHCH